MRNLIVFLLLATLPAAAQRSAWPTAGERAGLANLKTNSHIIVESSGPDHATDKCLLVTFAADAITCVADASPHARLTIPMREVQAVYRIRGINPTLGIVVVAALGFFLGSLVAEWIPGIVFGLAACGIGVGVLQTATQSIFRGGWGAPPPPPQSDSHLILVYHQ